MNLRVSFLCLTIPAKNFLTSILAFKFLNRWASKFSRGLSDSVWTDHLNAGISQPVEKSSPLKSSQFSQFLEKRNWESLIPVAKNAIFSELDKENLAGARLPEEIASGLHYSIEVQREVALLFFFFKKKPNYSRRRLSSRKEELGTDRYSAW